MERIWEMPEIQALHRLPARSPLLPWTNPQKAAEDAARGPEKRNLSEDSLYKCLDGEWKFFLLKSPLTVEREPILNGWVQPSFDDSLWNSINVPGTWTRQGYDRPHYTNVIMPFEDEPPFVPEENPTGLYRLSFTLPQDWKGRRTVLHIGSAESVCMIWVNGHAAGCFKDTRLPSEFDITNYLNDIEETRENTIALMVIRWSDASFVEDQDQWWFGGIHRSVYLYSTEDMWIEDAEAMPDYDGSGTGVIPLKIRMGIKETVPGNRKCRVNWKLLPVENAPDMSDSTLLPAVAQGSQEIACNVRTNLNEIRTSITVENPAVWSHENPARYVLVLELREPGENGEEGRLIESTAFCTAFRSVRIDSRHLLINGKPIYIKGVNRHEHNEKTGKTILTEDMVQDIRLLKTHNFNAVRTCHYPDDERWYELCDKYGIYLIDEANIENHYYYDGLCRSEMYSYAYMIRVQRMVRRDKNHPSIMMWSLGNESGHGWNQEMMYAWCHSFDKTRPVHYEGGTRKEYTQSDYSLETLARGRKVTDIVCPMYPQIDLIEKWADTTAGTDENRPLIMCEYSHAMGNSNGSLADYWKAIRSKDGLQGGFIWDWIDQGLETIDEKGEKYWKYGGDFGDEPNDKDFCLNGVLLPDQTAKPVMKECFKVFQPVELTSIDAEKGAVTVENRFDFTALDVLSLKWELRADGVVFSAGDIPLPPVAPGETAQIELPFTEALAGYDGSAEVVFHGEFIYNSRTGLLDAGSSAGWSQFILKEAEKPVLSETAGLLAVAEAERLKEVLENQVLASPLEPSIFRCPTENDDQKTIPDDNRIGHDWVETLLDKTSWDSKTGAITADGKDMGTCTMDWSVRKTENGGKILQLDAEFNLTDALREYPKVGFTARISSDYDTAAWYGMGEHESYSDRCAGSPLGAYAMKLHDMETTYVVPQENGNRYGVRHVELSGEETGRRPLRIEADVPFCFSVLHHEPADLWKCFHTNELTDTTESGYYVLNIDLAQRGIGSATCGPDTLEQYRIRPGVYRASFRFIFQ